MALGRIRLTLLWMVPLLAACSSSANRPTPTATRLLLQYHTATSTPRSAGATPILPSPPPLGPSPTPFVHLVREGETLLGISSRYGVDLENLLIVNPGIDPRLLSIGSELIIPNPEGEPVEHLLPTPTPVPLELGSTRCYRTTTQGMWCLVEARNLTSKAVEGLTVLVTLVDQEGQPITMKPTYGPLNLLPEGGMMPLAVFFEDPPLHSPVAVATLIGAVQANETSSRYLQLEIQQTQSEPGSRNLSWRVQGEASLPHDDLGSGARLSLLLVAFNEDGDVVGFRKWEAESPIASGASVDFDIVVITLGPEIDHVELIAEAQISP
jgi:LysM repeat protein